MRKLIDESGAEIGCRPHECPVCDWYRGIGPPPEIGMRVGPDHGKKRDDQNTRR